MIQACLIGSCIHLVHGLLLPFTELDSRSLNVVLATLFFLLVSTYLLRSRVRFMPGFCSLLLASFSREEGRGEVAVVTGDRERALGRVACLHRTRTHHGVRCRQQQKGTLSSRIFGYLVLHCQRTALRLRGCEI